ncbi:MAG: hypothetical protein N2654_00355 [Deltaproteobacteria bacterium]|nr:hypothetical protein [Deltaproteobacteria bacterium]
MFALVYGIKNRNNKIIFVLTICFLVNLILFEISSVKPVPQYHRYMLPSYVFLIPLISRALVAYWNISCFVLLPVLGLLLIDNLRTLRELSVWQKATEFKREQFKNMYLASCDRTLAKCTFINKFNPSKSLKLSEETRSVAYAITDFALKRYFEARLNTIRELELHKIYVLLRHSRLLHIIKPKKGSNPFLNPAVFIYELNNPRVVISALEFLENAQAKLIN